MTLRPFNACRLLTLKPDAPLQLIQRYSGNNADLLDYYLPRLLDKATVQTRTPKKEQKNVTNVTTPKKEVERQFSITVQRARDATNATTPKKGTPSDVTDVTTPKKEVENATNDTPLKKEVSTTNSVDYLTDKLGLIEIEREELQESYKANRAVLSESKQLGLSTELQSRVDAVTGFYASHTGKYPDRVVVLNKGEVITDLAKCISRNLGYLQAGNWGAVQRTSLARLEAIREALRFHA